MIDLHIEAGIATILLRRPPVNAIDSAMLDGFHAAMERIEASEARVVLLRSEQKTFCAGADLAMVARYFAAPEPRDAMQAYVARLHETFDRLAALAQVTLAEIGGHALGGGLELALACDLRLVAEQALLGLPEAAVGLLPGAGGTQRLTRLCGPGTASRIILGAELIDGREAERLGLAQWVFPREHLAAEAGTIARRIAGLAPASLRAAKSCMAMQGLDTRAGYAMEQREIGALMEEGETRRRIEAFLAR